MAKRSSSSSSKPASKPAAAPAAEVATSTPVRKTVVPRAAAPAPAPVVPAAAAPKPLTYERIAERAYNIWRSGNGGSEAENWFRAEMELKNETGL